MSLNVLKKEWQLSDTIMVLGRKVMFLMLSSAERVRVIISINLHGYYLTDKVPQQWVTGADFFKLADAVHLIGTGDDITVLVRYVYHLYLLVLEAVNSMDTDEVKTEGSRTSALLGSESFASNGWDPTAAPEKQIVVNKDD